MSEADPVELGLRPVRDGDAAIVAGFATSAAESLAWCSEPTPPAPDTVIGWARADGVEGMVLVDVLDRPVAYGELWVDDDEAEVELAHLIVDPLRRGRGVGRHLTRLLAERARHHHDLVVMRVAPDNLAALRCYRAAGFVDVAADERREWNIGQPADYVWLRLG